MGGGEGREGTGQNVQSLVAHGEDCFFLRVRWEPRRALSEEGCVLTQLLTGAPWRLWEEWTGRVQAGIEKPRRDWGLPWWLRQ